MSFTGDLNAFENLIATQLKRLERAVVIGAGEEVVMRSPVGDPSTWSPNTPVPEGYVGGRFRANWQYGRTTRPTGDLPDIDASGTASKLRIMGGASSMAIAGNVHYITNNLHYAQKLENGWSMQAPQGMVALTVMAWQRIANEQAALINR